MKLAVIGANGQLGEDIRLACTEQGEEFVGLTHADIEIADERSVRGALERARADAVINTAAMHNVDACEADPARAFAVNAIGARNLAAVTRALDVPLVHVSTDYVFDGAKGAPYVESDAPRPLNVYGNSKLAGEFFVLADAPKGIVARVAGLFGRMPCRAKQGGLNFPQLMLKLGREKGEVRVVTDEVVSPTYTLDAARQLLALARAGRPGLYHATSQGSCTWHEYAVEIFRLAGMQVTVHEGRSADMPKKVPRPAYSVLDNANLRAAGLDIMPHWKDAIGRYVASLAIDDHATATA
jgi:dTDP-4-dehydrorhamnose reductase